MILLRNDFWKPAVHFCNQNDTYGEFESKKSELFIYIRGYMIF